jgi:hypothetical protein
MVSGSPSTIDVDSISTGSHNKKLIKEALRLHTLGFWIVTTSRKTKKPQYKEWQTKRVDEGYLVRVLAHPRTNMAIVLNQSPYIDVECDFPQAEEKVQEWFGGKVPPTPTWQSSRGLHRLFRRPKWSSPPLAGVLTVEGVEFRGLLPDSGAASIVPPSLHQHRREYEYLPGLSIGQVEPADLPEHIVKLIPVSGQKEGSESRRRKPPKSQADVLLKLLKDVDLWMGDGDRSYATIVRNSHREHYPVRSRHFKDWMTREFYTNTRKALNSATIEAVYGVLEGRARFEGERYPTPLRIAEHDGIIYLDLADPEWRVVAINKDGWRVVLEPPVRFRRPNTMFPLPVPDPTGSVQLLEEFINCDKGDWPLLLAWIVGALRPRGPYPVLRFVGPPGSAKTTALKVLRKTIDPREAPIRGLPKDEQNLAIAANKSHVLAFDNLSYISTDMSDALCRLSTGGGLGTRKLYTDDEEQVFDATRPVILSSIDDVGLNGDLLDRSITISIPPIKYLRCEDLFWERYEASRAQILGSFLKAMVRAMQRLPAVRAQAGVKWPRMIDFSQWAEAAETRLGIEEGTIRKLFFANQRVTSATAVEASHVVSALRTVCANHKREYGETPWCGTTKKLLAALQDGLDPDIRRLKEWPKNPRALSTHLRGIQTDLQKQGWHIVDAHQEHGCTWCISPPVTGS